MQAQNNEDDLIDYTDTPSQQPTTSSKNLINTFQDLLLKPELIKAIKDASLEHPSEIQRVVIPKAVLGVDVLCQGKSGTGKTVVFVLSTLQRLKNQENTDSDIKSPKILVISNTKEMAVQIASEYKRFSKYLNIQIETFYGGVDIKADEQKINDLQSLDIVIGTAGRILDLSERNLLNFNNVKIMVLDEIDHLFSSNEHRWTIQRIFYKTLVTKQTMMFTATLPTEIKEILLLFLKNPFLLEVDKQKNLTLHGLEQGYVNISNEKKKDKLIELIDKINEISQSVIFINDKRKCIFIADFLQKKGLPAISITSDDSTEERMKRFNSFKQFNYRFLVTTNLMARGIDIAEINLVVNYDMPKDANTYLHRVGRAGRFETRGVAVSFTSSEEDIVVLNMVQERFDVSIKEIK